jgi:hypothetical protein
MDMRNRTEYEPLARNDEYLWDGSGQPDPEIQRLEGLLGRFRHNSPVPIFPEIVAHRRWTLFSPQMRRVSIFASTAAAVAAIAFVTFLVHERKPLVEERKPAPVTGAGWDVSRMEGTIRIGTKNVSRDEGTIRLGVGQVLETDRQSRASLQAEQIGRIEVDPSTRLRLITMRAGLKRIALDHGIIHAYIWAPPGQFVVDTPSAVAIDLGCAYTLQVDDSGAGLVRTSLGWVGFKLNGHDSFIPAGAVGETRPKIGPGTPYFEDASLKFRSTLGRFDFDDNTPEQRAADLAIVLGKSRKRDALTLWHLLTRVEERQRLLVYDRLAKLAPPPAGVTKDGILRLDQPMLDLWWNKLGFDDISVWRHWERTWAETSVPVSEK